MTSYGKNLLFCDIISSGEIISRRLPAIVRATNVQAPLSSVPVIFSMLFEDIPRCSHLASCCAFVRVCVCTRTRFLGEGGRAVRARGHEQPPS